MPSEPDWLKYTGFTSMRELALEAMRNDATLRAARLPQAENEIQRTRATARLNPAKRVKERPNYAESSDDDDDDQSEEEQSDKADADFVVEDGSNEAMPDADYIPEAEAESEGGFPESRSEDPEESLHAGLRLEPSAELLPTALPHQLSAFGESLHTRLQPPLAEPPTGGLPTTGPLNPQNQRLSGQATINPHTSLSVSSATSLDGFSDFANAMSAGGRLKRLLDLEQQSHQLPVTSEQQRNDKQTNDARGVEDTQNPARKRARLRDRNVGLNDSEQRSRQVQMALGQQKNDKRNHSVQLMSPARLTITRIRDTATHIDALLEARGGRLGGKEEEYDKLDTILTYLTKLHRDLDAASMS